MRYRRLLILPALALIGCGDKDTDVGGTNAPLITPQEGPWSAGAVVLLEDGCQVGSFDDTGDTGGGDIAILAMTGAQSFTYNSDGEITSCALSGNGGAFTCDSIDEVEEDAAQDIYATISASFGGTFSSPTEGVLLLTLNITCVGEGCAAVEDALGYALPCTSRGQNTIDYAG